MSDRISIKTDKVDFSDILDEIEDGSILIPTFQRDFVWDNTRIREFIDSILKGYPVGSLVFWDPAQARFKTLGNISGLEVKSQSNPDAYVLDGRQRLSSLISVLHPLGTNFDKFYLNTRDGKVEYSSTPRNPRNYIRIGTLFNTYAIVDYLAELKSFGLPESEYNRISNLVKSSNRMLLTYEIGFVKMRGGTIRDAVEVFSRLNSKGQPISEDFMLQALVYDENSDFLLANRISEIISSLSVYNFSNIKRDLVFDCIFNYTDIFFIDGNVEDLCKVGSSLPEIVDRLEKDLTQAVDFLYNECGVIDYRLLPYKYQLIMLADFFRIVGTPSAAQRKELRKWFFATSYSNYFTSHSLAEVRGDIKNMREYAQGKSAKWDYSYGELNLKPIEKMSLSGVRSKTFVISQIMWAGHRNFQTLNIDKLFDNWPKTPGNSMISISRNDYRMVRDCLKRPYFLDALEYDTYALPKTLWEEYYTNGDKGKFIEMREELMYQIEKVFVQKTLESADS